MLQLLGIVIFLGIAAYVISFLKLGEPWSKVIQVILVVLLLTALGKFFLGGGFASAAEPQPYKPDRFPAAPADNRDDALAEVNAKRATRGLPPFARDEALTVAARAAARHRAERLIFGHVADTNLGDFRFLPPGTSTTGVAGGCAAYEPRYGWMSCCTWDNARSAGAAWAPGADGKRYMHLFVR